MYSLASKKVYVVFPTRGNTYVNEYPEELADKLSREEFTAIVGELNLLQAVPLRPKPYLAAGGAIVALISCLTTPTRYLPNGFFTRSNLTTTVIFVGIFSSVGYVLDIIGTWSSIWIPGFQAINEKYRLSGRGLKVDDHGDIGTYIRYEKSNDS